MQAPTGRTSQNESAVTGATAERSLFGGGVSSVAQLFEGVVHDSDDKVFAHAVRVGIQHAGYIAWLAKRF